MQQKSKLAIFLQRPEYVLEHWGCQRNPRMNLTTVFPILNSLAG
jgi:hypothetical protein